VFLVPFYRIAGSRIGCRKECIETMAAPSRALSAAHPGLPLRVPAIVPEREPFFPSLEFAREAITQVEMRDFALSAFAGSL